MVSKGSAGSEVVVGNADLSLGRGNIAYNNATTGISGGGNVSILGNISFGHAGSNDQGISVGSGTAGYNIVYGNYDGIVSSSSALVEYNRIYGNSNRGIYATNSGSTVLGNVVYSNLVGIVAPFNQTVRNNLIYANTDYGVALTGGGPTFENNTVFQAQGDAVRVFGIASNVSLANNILWVQDGRAITVSSDSQVNFDSDYNWFFLDGPGAIAGEWQDSDRVSLTEWRNAAFDDFASYLGDPLFVNPDGGDGFGYFDPVNDGRNDDFHLQSLYGSFDGASLVPVLDAVSGLPMALPGTPSADAAQSGAIDRGDAATAFGNEPAPDGGYVNIGAYGNTAQASLSPAQYIWVQAPAAGANVPQESDFTVRWRSFGFSDTVDIEVSPTGLHWRLPTVRCQRG